MDGQNVICRVIPPMYSILCDSPALFYLPLGESTLGSMALMGYCNNLCDTVIICVLLLVRIYLDVLEMVDSKDSGNLFDDTKHIPSKAHCI